MDTTVASRLKFFMDSKELSITQFADTCNIPRPTLSQLLSGRNKKLSDVIVKLIHDRFPELSVLWIMFGEGEMLVPAPINPALASEAEKFLDDAPSDLNDENLTGLTQPFNTPNPPVNKQVSSVFTNANSEPKPEVSPAFERKIRSITVFFDDGSYQEFLPAKK